MKIKKLPSGSYHALVYDRTIVENGKQKRKYISVTAPTKAEVMRRAAEIKEDRETIRSGNMTVRQAMTEYIEARRNVSSPTTLQGYEKMRNYNFPQIIDMPVLKLSQMDVQRSMDELARNHSPKTVKNAHGFLASVLHVCRPYMRLTTTLPQEKLKYKTLPSPDVIYRIVKGTKLELPVLLAMWLSFSISEIRGINKSDIQGNVLTLNRSIVDVHNRPVVKDAMKEENRSRRLILPEYLLNLINAVPGEYLIDTPSAHALSERWKRLQEKHNLTPRITFHDLRHVNASVMHLLNVPDKYAMERGGWKTDHTMKAVYQNTFSAERLRYDKLIDNYFMTIMQNEMQNTT